jgi:hypothetical protein
MKAEHRHELKTNALADMLGRTWRAIKTGPSRHGLLLAGIAIAVVVVAGTGYFVWKSHKESRSALWVKMDDIQRQLDESSDPDDVKKTLDEAKSTADANAGTMPARGLRFKRARALLRMGLDRLASDKRDEAVKDVQEARRLFSDLTSDPSGKDNDSLLVQEAVMSVAVADESLGSLEEAKNGYKKITDTYRSGPFGDMAEKRLKALENSASHGETVDFYNKLGAVTKTDVLPPPDNTKKDE